MTNNKSLYDLGVEYEAAAEVIKQRIAQKRKRYNSLANRICSNEAYILKTEISALYREHREAKDTAEYLKNYYSSDCPVARGGFVA